MKKSGSSADADISADEFKKWVYAKWSVSPEREMSSSFGHPAMFPLELARRTLLMFSYRGDVVLDPFAGSRHDVLGGEAERTVATSALTCRRRLRDGASSPLGGGVVVTGSSRVDFSLEERARGRGFATRSALTRRDAVRGRVL